MTALYISYNGLMEQLGQSQVLPYVRSLAKVRPFILVTFEKHADLVNLQRRAQFEVLMRKAGVKWITLRYHHKPTSISKLYDILVGFLVCVYICATSSINIVHSRGYIAAVIGLWIKYLFGVRFIFDMRGFWIDQRIEIGIWREDTIIVRIARFMETKFLQRADVVFALSSAAVCAMKQWPAVIGSKIRFEVVTTCTDLDLFKLPPRNVRKRTDAQFTVGYVGNAGPGYKFDSVLEMYQAIKRIKPLAKLKIVNRNDHILIKEKLKAHGFDSHEVELISCDYPQVPLQMWGIDLGIFFYEWRKANVSSVPTRMGEFLACGVPCLSDESSVGFLNILENENVGVVLRSMESSEINDAALRAVNLATQDDIDLMCACVARLHFSLEVGVANYERIYSELEK